MTKEELNESLDFFFDNEEIGITAYAILKGGNNHYPKKLDIAAEALEPLKKVFIDSLSDNIVHKNNINVLSLSSSDERTNVIYEYDLEIPEELNSISAILTSDNIQNFNFNDDDFSETKALLIEIGNNEKQLVIYKTMAPINIFGRHSFFLKKSSERFEKIDEEFIRISSGFQLLKVEDSLFVIDLNTLEKFFGFHDIIKREATQSIQAIEQIELLENPETLKELVDDVTFARKLTKVAKYSPVIQARIPNTSIISFTMTHPALKNKIRYNADQSKIQLDTKVSKDLFVKLLNDDFLTSELTKLYYDSIAKDGVTEESGSE